MAGFFSRFILCIYIHDANWNVEKGLSDRCHFYALCDFYIHVTQWVLLTPKKMMWVPTEAPWRCWTNYYKSGPTRCAGCLPACTSRCRESCNSSTTTRHYMPFRGDTHRQEWFQPGSFLPISMHNSGGNLASQMQSQLLWPSNYTPNDTQQTHAKLGLPLMQEELPARDNQPSRWRCQSTPPGYETQRHTTKQTRYTSAGL